jgi:predicted methyltransferase
VGLYLRRQPPLRAPWVGAALLLQLVFVPSAHSTEAFSDAFRATSKRSFADVEEWSRVFDDPRRDEWQKPDEVVAALDLRPGATVADLGAGTGYFSRRLSEAVGPTGAVLSIETQPEMVVHLRDRAQRERTANVVPILASPDNPRIPPGTADVVLVVDTLHHIDDRLEYLSRLKTALRAGGRVAVVEWRKEELPVGPPLDHKVAREQVVYEMTRAGYRLVREVTSLPYQYLLVFEPSPDASPGP